ncbi:MAG: adenosine deaminase [Kofleriaceae bacterium]
MLRPLWLLVVLGCGHDPNALVDAATDGTRGEPTDGSVVCTATAPECAAMWEQQAADQFDTVLGDPDALATFLTAMPKGGDLHNHLTGAVYAESYLAWGASDGDCVNSSSHSAVAHSQCSATNLAMPASGSFFDAIVGAWSMQGFVAGSENGHDHFFATFGKYGLVAGAHRDQTLGDVATRAAANNDYYVETMFNLAKNTGSLASSVSSGTVTAADLPALYTAITTNSGFAAAITSDAATIASARTGYRNALGCDELTTPPACDVDVRFIAQVSRTGAAAQIFGQLIGAFEIAKQTDQLVAANLSSPEDDSASITNYNLHMAMLDFLHQQYATTSPLHVTLHAGELSPVYLPTGSTANTFHIRAAVETGHAERIGHGLDLESETDPAGLLAEMAAQRVLVEVCLSSNVQILGISGANHPLATYLAAGVPVALATDDQGVSRSSIAGEFVRAALDQHLAYRELKTLARNSLEHAFLPGASLWTAPGAAPFTAVDACAPTATMALGDPTNATCAAYLATSARASAQWDLEHRFLAFERAE